MILIKSSLKYPNFLKGPFLDFLSTTYGKIAIAITVFILFVLLKKPIRNLIFKALEKIATKTTNQYDDEILEALKRPFDLLVLTIGFQIAINIIAIKTEYTPIINHTIQTLYTFLIYWALFKILTPISHVVIKSTTKLSGKELGKDLANLIVRFLQVVIIALGVITILQHWGYNITGFLASLGLVGMAIALAAKDTVANLFGSLVIFSDKPFKIGDWIKTPDVEGIVEEVGIRSTKVRTFAQALVSVPNATLANSSILNWSRMGKRRIKASLGLTYGTTNEQMQNIVNDIRQMLKEDEEIHQDVIHIYFTDFGDSALGIFCYFFTNTTNWAEYMRVREKVNFKIIEIVEKHGSGFAFPSQSIYIENQEKFMN